MLALTTGYIGDFIPHLGLGKLIGSIKALYLKWRVEALGRYMAMIVRGGLTPLIQ